MSRKSVNTEKIGSFLNEEYMLTAAQHIRSVLALKRPRELARSERRNESKDAFGRARLEFSQLIRQGSKILILLIGPSKKRK